MISEHWVIQQPAGEPNFLTACGGMGGFHLLLSRHTAKEYNENVMDVVNPNKNNDIHILIFCVKSNCLFLMNKSNNSSFTLRTQHEVHPLGFACFYAKPSECSGLCNVTLMLSCAGLQNQPPQPFITASNLQDGCSPKRMPLLCRQSSVRCCAFNIPFKSRQRRSRSVHTESLS